MFITDRMHLTGKFEDGGIEAHATNWCNCIRDRTNKTNSPIEKAAFATILAHMGNISYRTGTRVVYDQNSKKFVNNPVANKYINAKYRDPWKLPDS